jgi:hypothetical protein
LNLITAEVRARAVAEAQWTDRLDLATHANVADRRRAHRALGRGLDRCDAGRAVHRCIPSWHGRTGHDADAPPRADALRLPGAPGRGLQGVPEIAFEEPGGAAGNRHGSTAVFAQGVVTRGVLVDLAADGPLPENHGVFGELTDLVPVIGSWPL